MVEAIDTRLTAAPAVQRTARHRGLQSSLARVCLVLGCLALAGCSAVGMAYKNADHLMLDRLERFVELAPEQREALGDALEAGLTRHQREDLPVLVGRLGETRALVAAGLDRQRARHVMGLGRSLYVDTAASLIADVAPVLATLDVRQIEELESRMAAERARVREERLGDDPAARDARRVERTVKRIEGWTGRLDDAQRDLVAEMVSRVPSRTEAWLRFSERQETLLLGELRAGAGARALERRLRAWWIETAERDPDYRARTDQATQAWTELLVQLDATLTDAQRGKVLRKLERYARVFDGLAREAVAS